VVQMSKKISREDCSGTYIGITVFDEAVNTRFSSLPTKVSGWVSPLRRGRPGPRSTTRST
jgi:hypothetical protein